MAQSPTSPGLPFGERLLVIVRAQAEAIRSGDFEQFARLADQRDRLVAALGELRPGEFADADRAALGQAIDEAGQLLTLVRRLRDDTAVELRQVRQGHAALASYRCPGAQIASRPTRVDSTR